MALGNRALRLRLPWSELFSLCSSIADFTASCQIARYELQNASGLRAALRLCNATAAVQACGSRRCEARCKHAHGPVQSSRKASRTSTARVGSSCGLHRTTAVHIRTLAPACMHACMHA